MRVGLRVGVRVGLRVGTPSTRVRVRVRVRVRARARARVGVRVGVGVRVRVRVGVGVRVRALRVGLGLLLLGTVEDVLYVEHAREGEDLVGASQLDALDEHLGEGGLHGELGHPTAEPSEQPLVIERTQSEELLHRGHEGLHGWG